MSATELLTVAAEGGVIGDGRTGANLALLVGLLGTAVGWLALARAAGRVRFGNARTAALSAIPVGLAGSALAVLHLATADGGWGTGDGIVGAYVAVPLGLAGAFLGWRALTRAGRTAERPDYERAYE